MCFQFRLSVENAPRVGRQGSWLAQQAQSRRSPRLNAWRETREGIRLDRNNTVVGRNQGTVGLEIKSR